MTKAQRLERTRIINALADTFEASGVPYTCAAVVMQTIAPGAAFLCRGTIHKPSVMMLRASDEVHARYRTRQLEKDYPLT